MIRTRFRLRHEMILLENTTSTPIALGALNNAEQARRGSLPPFIERRQITTAASVGVGTRFGATADTT